MDSNLKIINLEKVNSTSEAAKDLALQGVSEWTIVLGDMQEKGHGRKGEDWFSPLGGLYFSIILPKSNINDLQTLTILAAFSVAQTLKENFQIEPLIKLPNDILLNQKKVCGILTENIIMGDKTLVSILGIGLNTNIDFFPDDLKDIAISLKQVLLKEVDNYKILEQIIALIKKQLEVINQ